MFEEFEVVFRYTRADALKDGVLVDVSERAREAGFRIPLAMTERVWNDCVYWPETEPAIQDTEGRLWDVLFMAAAAARRAAALRLQGATAFDLVVVPRGGRTPVPTRLVLHVGPGDAGEAVATLMFPDED